MQSDLEMSCLKHPRRELQVTPIVQNRSQKKDINEEVECLKRECRKQLAVIDVMTVITYVSMAGMLLLALKGGI